MEGHGGGTVTTMNRFDLRQTIIPFSLLRISNRFQQMKTGERIEIIWSDPTTPADLLKVLPPGSHEILLMEAVRGKNPGYRMQLKKISTHACTLNKGGDHV